MRVGTIQLFDENISGVGVNWYSPANTYDALGRGDTLSFAVTAFGVSAGGGTPAVTVQVEHSADGQNWTTLGGTAEINNVTIASNYVLFGRMSTAQPVTLHFVRLRVALTGGTTPQCRLKIGATTRTY